MPHLQLNLMFANLTDQAGNVTLHLSISEQCSTVLYLSAPMQARPEVKVPLILFEILSHVYGCNMLCCGNKGQNRHYIHIMLIKSALLLPGSPRVVTRPTLCDFSDEAVGCIPLVISVPPPAAGIVRISQLITLQRKFDYVFPERKLRGLIPNFYIHISVSD